MISKEQARRQVESELQSLKLQKLLSDWDVQRIATQWVVLAVHEKGKEDTPAPATPPAPRLPRVFPLGDEVAS
jgi:hypothetical protein